jgi:hypothetical protein
MVPRKLRVLIISMGGPRQEELTRLFQQDDDFEPPTFSSGIPSRSLRSRGKFFECAHQAGVLPETEWQAVQNHAGAQHFDCLQDVPVSGPRRGSDHDRSLHYSVELRRKAKTVNVVGL